MIRRRRLFDKKKDVEVIVLMMEWLGMGWW